MWRQVKRKTNGIRSLFTMPWTPASEPPALSIQNQKPNAPQHLYHLLSLPSSQTILTQTLNNTTKSIFSSSSLNKSAKKFFNFKQHQKILRIITRELTILYTKETWHRISHNLKSSIGKRDTKKKVSKNLDNYL